MRGAPATVDAGSSPRLAFGLSVALATVLVLCVGPAQGGQEGQQPQAAPLKQTTAADEFKALRQKAERGDATAQFDLGSSYAKGEGVPQDYAEAVSWFRKAAEQGYANAQFILSVMYGNGQGVAQDDTESVRWCRRATEQWHARASHYLGLKYVTGSGVAQDFAEAHKWFNVASALSESLMDQKRYGDLRDGIVKDMPMTAQQVADAQRRAREWMASYKPRELNLSRQRAEQGDVEAQNVLGWMYKVGRDVPQDYAESVKWYRRAADGGDARALNSLGAIYAEGRLVAQDYAEAAKWYRQAAQQGNADAQNDLGKMYAEGNGVARDYAEAVRWYRLAAEQGDTNGHIHLAGMYFRGQGVGQDYVEAHKWYNIASALESGELQVGVAQLRDNIAKKMTPAQIAEAQKRASEWMAAFEKRKK